VQLWRGQGVKRPWEHFLLPMTQAWRRLDRDQRRPNLTQFHSEPSALWAVDWTSFDNVNGLDLWHRRVGHEDAHWLNDKY
jgi:hypothetical protein